ASEIICAPPEFRSTRSADLRNLAKGLAGCERLQADQARVFHRGLAMFHRLAVDGIADHFDEGANARIFRDEAVIPVFALRPDQHQFEAALPCHLAAKAREHRTALAAVGRVGLRARRRSSVGVRRAVAQLHQIEHVNGTGAIALAKLGECFLGRIDVTCHLRCLAAVTRVDTWGSHMNAIANTLVALVAALHVYFLTLEMFFWTRPLGLKTFRNTPEKAADSAVLAANQGLYNGFLAAGLIWGLMQPNAAFAFQVKVFFLLCVIVAGIYGAATVSFRILLVQAAPAVLALILLWLA